MKTWKCVFQTFHFRLNLTGTKPQFAEIFRHYITEAQIIQNRGFKSTLIFNLNKNHLHSWFWKSIWLNDMFARCTRIAHLSLQSMDWDRSVVDLKVPDESLSTSRTSQLAWKIGSQNQSIRHSWVCCVLFCVSFTHGACLWMCFFPSFFFFGLLRIHKTSNPLREWRAAALEPETWRSPQYCAPLVCVFNFQRGLLVWWLH